LVAHQEFPALCRSYFEIRSAESHDGSWAKKKLQTKGQHAAQSLAEAIANSIAMFDFKGSAGNVSRELVRAWVDLGVLTVHRKWPPSTGPQLGLLDGAREFSWPPSHGKLNRNTHGGEDIR
jgi:hypothetical protein